ncbi:MAG TPA: hypothetical protein VMB52_03735 [Verrucomicrobiae bacterium]|nr:hypothetical protein [Verrucomicrobiae bacterium]
MGELLSRVVHEVVRPVTATVLVGVLGATSLASDSVGTPPDEARGIIICPVGEDVEGAWVDAGTGQGWAHWSAVSQGDANVAGYYRDVGERTNYRVHVGCGGSRKNWEHPDYAQRSSPSDVAAIWECGPNPDRPLAVNGICRLVGKG